MNQSIYHESSHELYGLSHALPRATYYFQGNDDSYLKYNIVRELMYDGTKENLSSIVNTFENDIKIRTIFGHNDIHYKITNAIAKNYDKLLLSQVDVILIVTRYDQAIKIVKKPTENDETKYDMNIAVIKLDSVIAELNLNSSNYKDKYGTWYYYPLYLGIFFGIGLLCKRTYTGDLLKIFYKSD